MGRSARFGSRGLSWCCADKLLHWDVSMGFNDFDALLGQAGAAAAPKRAQHRSAILVIDDDPAVRASLETVLADHHDVALYASAQEGVAAIHDNICAVILDVKLKGPDGFWACDRIHERYPHMPIIFYSAYQNLKDPYEIINEHRPFGYLVKDGNINRLLKMVDTAVQLYTIIHSNEKLVRNQQDAGTEEHGKALNGR
jgi:DNA-binding NtrC family response regulator